MRLRTFLLLLFQQKSQGINMVGVISQGGTTLKTPLLEGFFVKKQKRRFILFF